METIRAVKKLDLTGDRPLREGDARALARWWTDYGWDCSVRRAGRYFYVTATKG
jgi:hypothetical protein